MKDQLNLKVENLHISYRTYLDPQVDLRHRFKAGFGAARRRHLIVNAVQGVTFNLKKGETLGIIGHNGAGKSTLLLGIAGLIKADDGQVLARSRPTLLGVGSVLNTSLSGRRNIEIGCLAIGMDKDQIKEQMDDLIEFSGLREAIDRPLKSYSTGMRARLTFTVATVKEPEVLLIDEALAVGDNEFRERAYQRIEDIRSAAGSVILVSHNTQEIQRMSDRVIWMDQGQIVRDGSPDALIKVYKETKSETELLSRMNQETFEGTGPLQVFSFSTVVDNEYGKNQIEIKENSLIGTKELSSSVNHPKSVDVKEASDQFRSSILQMASNETITKHSRLAGLLHNWFVDHSSGALMLNWASESFPRKTILLQETFAPNFLDDHKHWITNKYGDLFIDEEFPSIESNEDLVYCWSRYPNYYLNWWIDVATRAYQFLVSDELQDRKFLMPHLNKFQQDALEALGIDSSLIYEPKQRIENIRHIYFEDSFHLGGRSNVAIGHEVVAAANAAKQRVLTGINNGKDHTLFVTLGKSGTRRMLNQLEVENALKREGVKVISLEDHSFQEIVEMFSSASTVIGVSGDALANTIFSRPGTNVIELLPDTWVSSLQKEISAKAQLSHNYLACEAFGEGRFNQQMALYDSIQIPIDRLLSLLSDLENI